MEQKHNITDEQIARFLDGTASEEEKEVILEYMSQSDENLDELMSIADAVQAQRESSQAVKQSNNRAVVWRVAASVAVVLVAGGIWFALRDRGVNLEPQAGNTVAMNSTPQPTPTVPTVTEPGASDGNTSITGNNTNNQGTGMNSSQQAQGDYRIDRETGSVLIAHLRVNGEMEAVDQLEKPQPDFNHACRCRVPSQWTIGTDLLVTWEAKEGTRVEFRIINSKNTNTKDRNRWMTFQDTQGSIRIDAEKLIRLIVGYEGDRHELIWELQPYFDNENLTHPVPPQRGRITVNYSE